MSAVKLSVVVVSWNCRKDVVNCLRSLQDGGLQAHEYEIIVVDNGSWDGTIETVRKEFPHVRVIEAGGNIGFAAANNLAFPCARGNHVLVLNPDTSATHNSLRDMVACAAEEDTVGAFGFRIVDEEGRMCRSAFRFPSLPRQLLRAFGLGSILGVESLGRQDVESVSGCCMLFRKDALRHVGGFDDQFFMYYEDVDICARLRTLGYSIRYEPSVTIIHRGGGSSRVIRHSSYVEERKSLAKLVKKHRGQTQALACRATVALHAGFRLLAGTLAFCFSPSSLGPFLKSNAALFAWAIGAAKNAGITRP